MSRPVETLPVVLLVDDDPRVLEAYARLLEGRYRVETAPGARHALAVMSKVPIEVLVTDVCMPGVGGLALARAVVERHPEIETVVMTADPEIESAMEFLHLGVADYLRKPFRGEDLEAAVQKALERRRMRESLTRMQAGARHPGSAEPLGLGRLVGVGPAMQRLRAAVARVQHVDTTILITGSTGSGKEVVARALHEGGHRAGAPFVALNCAALSKDLLESELFGYQRGAFTGADRDRPGLIEQARGGTLFLDEVGELPQEVQAKLLRVLQEKRVRRIGEAQARDVDVRFLAATNRDLAAAVRAGHFREDLLYRLNVFPIRVPSLARRRDDIPDLARHLAVLLAEEQGLPRRELSREVLEALQARRWPGNVRELRNVVERLLLVADDEVVTRDHLEVALDLDALTPLPTDFPPEVGPEPHNPLHDLVGEAGGAVSLAALEAAHIARVLRQCDGNKAQAARILGIHVSTLYRKLGE